MTHYNVVIVGAGHAGVQLATSLVQGGYAGSIALLSAENVEPYERPPLSKSYLAGEQSRDDILFRPSEYWANSPVDLQLGAIVTSVDPENFCASDMERSDALREQQRHSYLLRG